jgi:type III pantothenate kinase
VITGIIDIGNTTLKAGVFEDGQIARSLCTVRVEDFNDFFCGIEKMLVASVAGISDEVRSAVLQILPSSKIIFWDKPVSALKLPFSIDSERLKTTGVDRLAIAAGAAAQYPKRNVLCIALGTCVTYNFISSDTVFKPGAISAGLSMRLRAMNNDAPALPLVHAADYADILPLDSGSVIDTPISMLHGSVNGLWYEMLGYINEYSTQYNNLTVLITGGDLVYYKKYVSGISRIFATPNLVLQGFNEILQYNNF